MSLLKKFFSKKSIEELKEQSRDDYEKAIKSYQQAQEIYPSMQSPKIMIEKIKKLIKKQSV